MAYDLIVIGSGPGGYVCAVKASQLGMKVAVVEKRATYGGTCLNIGCIPSKALIHAAEEFHKLTRYNGQSPLGIRAEQPTIDLAQTVAWKDGIVSRLNAGVAGLLKKAGTRLVTGRATFLDGKTVKVTTGDSTVQIRAQAVVIATGSEPVELPFLPFGGKVISSTEALALTKVPETLCIVGAGYIGLEIGIAFAKLGAKVAIVEAEDRILPQYDSALTRPVLKTLHGLGIDVHLATKAKGESGDGLAADMLEQQQLRLVHHRDPNASPSRTSPGCDPGNNCDRSRQLPRQR